MKLAPLAMFAVIVGFALVFTPVFLLNGGTVTVGQWTSFSPSGSGLINASQKANVSYTIVVAGALTTSANESGGQVQGYSNGWWLLGPSLVMVVGVAVSAIAYFIIRKGLIDR
jgi:hypothetical protein